MEGLTYDSATALFGIPAFVIGIPAMCIPVYIWCTFADTRKGRR